MLIDVGRASSLWGAPFPRLQTLECVGAGRQAEYICLPSLCVPGCSVMSMFTFLLDFLTTVNSDLEL